jgi:dihydroorotate dehydrogenase (fumarate)
VKRTVRIPVAVKVSPFLTAFAHFAAQLDAAGANGLVLFTRFYQADIDVVELEIVRKLELSNSSELRLRLRGAAVLSGRVKASLAITGGVHSAIDVIKSTMAGAHVMQMVSALLQNGPRHLGTVLKGIEDWMQENEWNSLNEMRGNMSYQHVPDPAAYERELFRSMFAMRNHPY